MSNQIHPDPSQTLPDLLTLTPTMCDNSLLWNLRIFGFCMTAVITPIVVLSIVYQELAAVVVVATVCGLLWCYCIISLRRVCWEGGVAMPPPPPAHGPFILTVQEGEKNVSTNIDIKRVLLIVNPNGGVKAGMGILEKVKHKFDAAGVELTVKYSEYGGHARHIAQTEPLDGISVLAIIGGDGSFHEIVNGMLARTDFVRVPVGLIPGGSGNAVMADLGTWDPLVAVDRILSGVCCWMDTIHVHDDGGHLNSHSINSVNWGLVGEISVAAERYRWMGPARYDVLALWGVLKGQHFHAAVEFDDIKVSKETPLLTAFVTNTQYFGKGMRASPNARINDGLMDVTLVYSGATRGELLATFNQMPKGSHMTGHEEVCIFAQTKTLLLSPVITSPTGFGIINVDGENYRYKGSLHMTVCPREFLVCCPPDVTMMTF